MHSPLKIFLLSSLCFVCLGCSTHHKLTKLRKVDTHVDVVKVHHDLRNTKLLILDAALKYDFHYLERISSDNYVQLEKKVQFSGLKPLLKGDIRNYVIPRKTHLGFYLNFDKINNTTTVTIVEDPYRDGQWTKSNFVDFLLKNN